MKHRDFYVYQVAETVLNTSIRTVGFVCLVNAYRI